VTGTPGEPAKAGCSIADIAAAQVACNSILAALIQRGRSQRGCRIDVSMLEAMVEWMSYPLYYAYGGAEPPQRAGAAHATIFPYGPFPAGDGRVVMLGLQNEREWRVFCEHVLLRPDLAADPRFAANAQRVAEQQVLRESIVSAFASLSAEQVCERLDAAQIASARVNDMHEVWQHAQLRARERWASVATPTGAVPALLPPGASADGEARMGPVPALGEHTEAILAGLGYSPQAIAQMHAEGAI
jgi:crotonobetainyl-CoA:carnitine CoA-transferase CaiB-like acyl-CoA transferase